MAAVAAEETAPGVSAFVGQEKSLSGKGNYREKNELSDKENLSGNGQIYKRRERHTISLPGKERREVAERRGWIEYAKRGTKNPKQYAYRRRWLKQDGRWVKSKVKRLKSIPPLTEDDYVKRITREGRDPTTGRRKSDRSN